MVSPAGAISLPLNYLRETVASSAQFQAETSTVSQAAALAFVHAVSVATPSQSFYAVVDFGGSLNFSKHAGGVQNHFTQRGDLNLWFTQTLTESTDIDAAYDFTNAVGSIVAEMRDVAGTATYLDITEMDWVEGPFRPDDEEVAATGANYYRTLIRVSYESVLL